MRGGHTTSSLATLATSSADWVKRWLTPHAAATFLPPAIERRPPKLRSARELLPGHHSRRLFATPVRARCMWLRRSLQTRLKIPASGGGSVLLAAPAAAALVARAA